MAVSVNGETKELTTQDRQMSFDIFDTDKVIAQVAYKRNNTLLLCLTGHRFSDILNIGRDPYENL